MSDTKIKLEVSEKSRIYNLSGNDNYNIFYGLYFGLHNSLELDDYIFFFSLVIADTVVCRISNIGSRFFCSNWKNVINEEDFIYYPINLFEAFEKGFIDIHDISGEEVYIKIEYIRKNHDNTPEILDNDIDIMCNQLTSIIQNKIKNLEEYVLVEKTYFSKDNNIKIINEKTLSLSLKLLCPLMYITFLGATVKSMSIIIDDNEIKHASSRILIDNDSGVHSIWFFPDSDNDFIKKSMIQGVNFSIVDKIFLQVELIEKKLTEVDVILGVFTYNVLSNGILKLI
jgi:hypothetical protein